MIPDVTKRQWEKIGYRHHHGIALPLSAIRTPTGSGIGEYRDLIPLIEWCASCGFDIIQLLPLNDSGSDPSPYSAHSALALHPIYLSLRDLPEVERVESWDEENRAQRVNYLEVLQKKEQFLRRYFSKVFHSISYLPGYLAFIQENPWVEGYALYKALKSAHHDLPWWEWEEALRTPSEATLKALKERYQEEMNYHQFVQYLCFDQLQGVKATCDKVGIFLKGDIPILINRDSADVWLHRELFLLGFSAGAPPDMFSKEGQFWGFPLYNWQEVEKEHFAWWRTRLQVAEKLYHLYRIDHIVGFFKIWAIPMGKTAKEGFFMPQDENEWLTQGEKILRMMCEASFMLPIGEDLGAVPDSVRSMMQRLGIAGTKVLRWERRWHTDQSFIDPKEFSPLSMSCVSTHDSETLWQWWTRHPDEAHLGYPHATTLPRKEILKQCHSSGSLFHINLLQEYLSLFPELSWPNPDDERINIPGVILDTNWTYRFRPFLQEIISHTPLRALLEALAYSL